MLRLDIASLFVNANRLKAAAKKRRLSRRLATTAQIRLRRLRIDPWKFCHLAYSCRVEKAIKSGRIPEIRDALKALNSSLPKAERLPEGLWNDRSSPLFCLCGGKRLHVVFIGPGSKVDSLYSRREQIRQMLDQVLQAELFQFSAKVSLCQVKALETEYLVTNLALVKPSSSVPSLPNDIVPYAEALLQRDFRRHLESFGAPQEVVRSLSISILRIEDRPRKVTTGSGELTVILPRVVIRSSTDIKGPFFVGYLNAVGYGRVAALSGKSIEGEICSNHLLKSKFL